MNAADPVAECLTRMLRPQHHITAPPPRKKYHSASDEVMLEDESGRVRLVGKPVDDAEGVFVTGAFALLPLKVKTLAAISTRS